MKLNKAISYIGLGIAAIAVIGWIVSIVHPIGATLIRKGPDECWFFATRGSKLVIWAQQITPPPPDVSYTVLLSTPFHMRVSGPGGLFSSNFSPEFPFANLGWNTAQESKSTVFGAGGSIYNFALRVHVLVLPWWVIALMALVPLAMRKLTAFLRGRKPAYNTET